MKVDFVLMPGDLWDSPDPSYDFFTETLTTIKKHHFVRIITIAGQHDLLHRRFQNTAMRALISSVENIIYLSSSGDYSSEYHHGKFVFQGSGFGEEIPPIKEECFNILLTHRMIIMSKLWEDQTDYEYASAVIRRHKYNLIVSGDNHKSFVYKSGKRILVNCGAMMRSHIDQTDHLPQVVYIDTNDMEPQPIFIPIIPAKEVFNMEKVIHEKAVNEKISAFVNGLSTYKATELSFTDNLNSFIQKEKLDPVIVDIIKECMYEENN